ncbi:hypothetical protein EDB89DRAFT_2162201 [Lactarius sanguifluus]|nr:hypothetical protein EDB89DRAFT_2162201 [Lactarius sanguifluus]
MFTFAPPAGAPRFGAPPRPLPFSLTSPPAKSKTTADVAIQALGEKRNWSLPKDNNLLVFDILNIFHCRWFLSRDHLLANVISAQKVEDGKLSWVEFNPPFHSHLVKCTVMLVPCPLHAVKWVMFVFILELLDGDGNHTFFNLQKGGHKANNAQKEKRRLARNRARSKFQPEYITQLTTDELSDCIKGAAIWAEINNVEGYYIFNLRKKEYHQIHYLEDRRLWAYIDYSPNERSWYTIGPVPLELNVGPLKSHNPKGIDVDSEPDNSPSVSVPTTTFTPSLFVNPPDLPGSQPTPQSMSQTHASASTTLTSGGPAPPGSGGAPSGGPSGGAAAPSGGSAAPGGSLMGGGASGGSAPGGGGGGAGGGGGGGGGAGGAPIPPVGAAPAAIPPTPGGHGRLGGNPPPEFNGDQEKSKQFMLAFNLYREMNPTVDQLTIPYPHAMTFLSYIRGVRT